MIDKPRDILSTFTFILSELLTKVIFQNISILYRLIQATVDRSQHIYAIFVLMPILFLMR